jgi:hypothetical protein
VIVSSTGSTANVEQRLVRLREWIEEVPDHVSATGEQAAEWQRRLRDDLQQLEKRLSGDSK